MKWIERWIGLCLATAASVSVTAHYLPRVLSYLLAIGVVVAVLKVVWFLTR